MAFSRTDGRNGNMTICWNLGFVFILLAISSGQFVSASSADDLDTRILNFVNDLTGFKQLEEAYSESANSGAIKFKEIDRDSLINDITNELGELFKEKIEALQESLKHAEKLTETYEYDPKLKEVDYLLARDLNESLYAFEESKKFPISVNFENSSVHIPIDIFIKVVARIRFAWKKFREFSLILTFEEASLKLKGEVYGDVEILNSIAWTKDMDQVWKSNKDKYGKLLWQYFGSKSGMLRTYPGSVWPVAEGLPDLYDVRRRSWYTGGISSPKDMFILIDSSGSSHGQALALMKHSLKSMMDTLGEDDYVAVANFPLFPNDPNLVPCFPTFLQATHRNKKRIIECMQPLNASGIANFSRGLEFAFQYFENFTSNENISDSVGANCNRVIMLLTDGGTELPEAILNKYNANKTIRIFTYAVGPIAGATPAIKWIGCTNRGFFYQIPSMVAIRSKVQAYTEQLCGGFIPTDNALQYKYISGSLQDHLDYLTFLANPSALASDQHSWTSVYRDKLQLISGVTFQEISSLNVIGLGRVISVTIPVFNRSEDIINQTVLGVLGVDISIAEIQEIISQYELGSTSYAFAINPNGFILFHPGLKETEDETVLVDIMEVEDSTSFESIRQEMIDQVSNKVEKSVYISGLDEHHADFKTRTYYYAPIPNTNFSVGIVLPDYVKYSIDGSPTVDKNKVAQLLMSNETAILFDIKKYCGEIEPVSNISTEMEDFVEVLVNSSQCDDDANLQKLLFDIQVSGDVAQSWLTKQNQYSDKTGQLEFSNAGTPLALISHRQLTDKNESLRDGIKSTFVATNSGLTRVFPTESSEEFAEKKEPWKEVYYKRALDNDWWMFSVQHIEQDFNSSDQIVLATKAVSVKDYKIAVVGIQITPSKLHDVVFENFHDCLKPDESVSCYVLEDGGYVVSSNDDHHVGKYFGELSVEPLLMQQLVNDSIFTSRVENDFQSICIDIAEHGAGIRLLPPFIFEMLSLNWWTTASTWSYMNAVAMYSWLFPETSASAAPAAEHEVKPEEPTERKCIKALYKYHLSTSLEGEMVGTFTCDNCTRTYTAEKLKSSNLLSVIVKGAPCQCENVASLPFRPEENPLADYVRYRRRPPCFDHNPDEQESYCRGCSLVTTTRLYLGAATAVVLSQIAKSIALH